MTAGRPSKYKPAYCNEVKEHLGEGFSLTSFGGIIGVSRQTIYSWAESHEEFLDAVKVGRAKGQHVWEKRLADQAMKSEGNTAAIIFAMKNLYQDDWTDKVISELTGKDGGPLSIVVSKEDAEL